MGLLDKFKKKEKEEEVFKQQLDQMGGYANIYRIELLFEAKGKLPLVDELHQKLCEKFGETDIISGAEGLCSFAIHKYPVTYKDNQQVPAQVLMADYTDFDEASIDGLIRSQCWDCENVDELLSRCRYKLMISDFMAGGLPYPERCEMLMDYLDVVLEVFPECIALYWPHSMKVMTVEDCRNNPYGREMRFLNSGLNVRFFNIQGTDEMLVDTTGLYALGIPDVQCHFRNLEPNDIVRNMFNLAAYIFEKGDIIEDGNTTSGLTPDEKWKCQHEESLIQPLREVIDVNAGANAAGERE